MEIKFRWVGLNKMHNTVSINTDLTIEKILERDYMSFFCISNRTESGNCNFLSEDLFTGLVDKNGMEIYAGDILNFGGKSNVPVVFENGAFTIWEEPIGWDYDSESGIRIYDLKFKAEVIGNIYENPEILLTI